MSPYLKIALCILGAIGAYILIAIGLSTQSQAMEVPPALAARGGGEEILFFPQACSNSAVLQHIPAADRPSFHRAEAFMRKGHFHACWRPSTDGASVQVVYDDGDGGSVPMALVKPDWGA